MPGQRFLNYRINPEPKAHYLDFNGNIHAYYTTDEIPAGADFIVEAEADVLSSDRWTFLDPRQMDESFPDSLSHYYNESYPDDLSLDNPFNRSYTADAVGSETNPYWKLRSVHDAIIETAEYTDPPDESVEGFLKSGKGVCRNFCNALQTLGRIAGIPMMEAWAPHHDLPMADLPGAGWIFVDITWNNYDEGKYLWEHSRWFGGLPSHYFLNNVNGLAILTDLYIDDREMTYFSCGRRTPGLDGFKFEYSYPE